MQLDTLQIKLKQKEKYHKEYDDQIKNDRYLSLTLLRDFKQYRAQLKREIKDLKAKIETHPDYKPTKRFTNATRQ